jgi:two-component sensor histidine kinase/CHASE1-domain containing sensor protein
MAAGQAFYAGSRAVNRDEFREFARVLLAQAPVMQSLEWAPRVTAGERTSFEQAIRQEGYPNFQITECDAEGKLVPAGGRLEYYPILFLEPYAANRAAMGFDPGSEAVRSNLLVAAIRSGRLRATPPLKLVQDNPARLSCLLLAPVYHHDNRRLLEGFIVGVLRPDEMLNRAFGELHPGGISIEICDVSPGGVQPIYYRTPARKGESPNAGGGQNHSGFEFLRSLSFGGRTWQIRCMAASGRYNLEGSWWPWAALVCGFAITALSALLLLNFYRRHERTELLVEARTAGLRRLNLMLEQEICNRQRIEERLEKSLREKEVLLREIHHRVKNNLQVISSLLKLQAAHIGDPHCLRLVSEIRNRVRSMGLVYEKLQTSDSLAQIDFGEYLRSLAAALARSCRKAGTEVKLEFDFDRVLLNLDTAIPCGLIVTELLSNSFKYAFNGAASGAPARPDRPEPVIAIGLHLAGDGALRLTVRDNGSGLPAGLGLDNPTTVGLQIVHVLVEQLNGSIQLDRSGGTAYSVTFQELKYAPRN